MKFLVPNYSCLQNPWLGGYRLQIPVLSVLNWICWTPPPPEKNPGYATAFSNTKQWLKQSPYKLHCSNPHTVLLHTKHSRQDSAVRVTEINGAKFLWTCNLGNPLGVNTKFGTIFIPTVNPEILRHRHSMCSCRTFLTLSCNRTYTDQAGSTDIPYVPSFTLRGKCTIVTALSCFPQLHQIPSKCPKLGHYHFPHIITSLILSITRRPEIVAPDSVATQTQMNKPNTVASQSSAGQLCVATMWMWRTCNLHQSFWYRGTPQSQQFCGPLQRVGNSADPHKVSAILRTPTKSQQFCGPPQSLSNSVDPHKILVILWTPTKSQ